MHQTQIEPELESARDARSVRLLRVREVSTKTGLSRAYIYKLERQGEFPKRRKIAENCVGWLEHEVDKWCLSRPVVELAG
jgi:prophage regulatory protein